MERSNKFHSIDFQANKTIGLLHACPVDEGNAELIDEVKKLKFY